MTAAVHSLPKLPGYDFRIPKTNHAKSHVFVYKNGIACQVDIEDAGEKPASKVLIPPSLDDPATILARKASPSDVMSRLPKWVTYDREVLRFYAWFIEDVHDNADETKRLRKFVICYYLEDDTMRIDEEYQENSGCPQGIFLKRSKVPKNAEEYYTFRDLAIGETLNIVNRPFMIIDADKHTRDYYVNTPGLGSLKEPLTYPYDSFTYKLTAKAKDPSEHGDSISGYMEAQNGRATRSQLARTKQFLTHDRKVLRFYCQWDDSRNLYGEKRNNFVLHYFMADNTIEILEKEQPNSGRDPFPTMVKRQRLPKNMIEVNMNTIGSISEDCYKAEDLLIGKTISIYGRKFLLTACDDFTKNYYTKMHALTPSAFIPIDTKEPPKKYKKAELPPPTGYGTEEDSLGSVKNLVPTAPRKDVKKMLANEGKSLRYLSKYKNPQDEDVDRRFVITYFLADDEISIFERRIPNSGILGGKFLEKTRMRNTDGNYFKPQDFDIGKIVQINSHDFEVIEMDAATVKMLQERGLAAPEKALESVKDENEYVQATN